MSEVRSYHLQRLRLEAALPKMLERCLERGEKPLGLGVVGGPAAMLDLLQK